MNPFLSCDWGTSTFRLRIMDPVSREISGQVITEEGIADTYRQWLAAGYPETERIHFYQRILIRAIGRLPGTTDKNWPVIISGMASSSIGMLELPYQEFPFTWRVSDMGVKKIDGDERFSHPLYLVPGFKTHEDVMRGEETLLLGCDSGDEGKKIFVFPGTHSKHVFVDHNTGVDFKTFMTGEIFSLLAEKSILQDAVSKGADEKSFKAGFGEGMEGNILNLLFKVRTRRLLNKTSPESNYQYLSGLLIGTEMKDLAGKEGDVYLVCGEHLKQAYLQGLEFLVRKGKKYFLNADEMFLNGHFKIAEQYL